MKNTLNSLIKTVKSIKGNSLAEFATTTALMATLAATAAPKLSEMSEGTKAEKSRNEIDKIVKQGGQFYQDTADEEGRGRFPNQKKFNQGIGDQEYDNAGGSKQDLEDAQRDSRLMTERIMTDLALDGSDGWQNYTDEHATTWVSVFGGYDGEATLHNGGEGECNPCDGDVEDDVNTPDVDESLVGVNEWSGLFGDEELESTFQDGHYAYVVVPGGGTGSDVYPPVLYVVDIENARDFNNVLEP